MEIHERRFLTMDDLAYLEAVEVALVRVHGVSPERASGAVLLVARQLQRLRTRGDHTAPTLHFALGGPSAHAEVIAAVILTPKMPGRFSLAVLAVLAAAAGLLGMRVLLAVVFRRFVPVQIGWVDVTLATVIVAVILRAARALWLPDRLGRTHWFSVSLVLGAALGLGATALLRTLGVQGTIVSVPLWLAAALALACGALTWLLTWPDDRTVYRGGT